MTAREAYSLYVERAVAGANEADGLLSSALAAVKLGAAFFGEGAHALLVVLAVEAIGDQLVEQGQIALGFGAGELLDGGLRRQDRERRIARDGERVVAREPLEIGLGHDLVDQPHAQGVLGGPVRARGKEDLLRVGRADELDQLVHAVVVIAEAEPGGGDAEARVVGGDADVAADGDADTLSL